MDTRSLYDVPIVLWSLLTLLIHMLTCLGTNGFSIKLIPRYSIDSVHFPKNFNQQNKHNRFADAINSTKQGTKALEPVVWNFQYMYATKVAIGKPPYIAMLLLDTGSDQTWVQGEGCKECFKLKYGNFKYKESTTYAMVSCDHPLCNPRICVKNICRYNLEYEDGAYSKGYLSSETFTFPYVGNAEVEYTNVIFGVGLRNSKKPFMRKKNIIGGILGLGSGPRSILRQLEYDTDLRFSYCLFDVTNGDVDTYTYLHFGEDAKIIGNDQARVKSIQLLPDQNHYYVEVVGITMNGYVLPINPRDLQLRDKSKSGFIIDSGATITYLVPKVYKVVREEVVRYLEAYNWKPMVNSGLDFDLCYNVQPTEDQKFPSLGINFVEANLDLGSHQVFKEVLDNIYCMLIDPNSSDDDSNVLGAIQQQDYRFLFDVRAGVIQFVPEKCKSN